MDQAQAVLNTDAPPTIWQELDIWATEFKPWQRYIAAHIIREGALTPKRVDDAYALFLHQHDLSKVSDPEIEIPDTLSGRPTTAADAPIYISRICNLERINALPENADLTFGPNLTVIYGCNGAGKSGFVRVFANACFSRAQYKILPNINDVESIGGQGPAADITVRKPNQADATFKFDGKKEHQELKRIAIFDAEVARVHLSAPNAMGFKPTGFDIFPEMARCYDILAARLDAGSAAKRKENVFPKSFISPQSNVSELIESLTYETDLGPIRESAVFGETEIARLIEIQRQIGELQSHSIPEAISQLQKTKEDLVSLTSNITAMVSVLDGESREQYKTQVADVCFRNRTVTEQGAASFTNRMLKSVGGTEWETFIEFGRELGKIEHEGYPTVDDRCLFCQQPLDSSAHALIHRIWAFLGSEAREQAYQAGALVSQSVEALDKLDFEFFSSTTTCHANLTRINPALANKINDLIITVRSDYYEIFSALCDTTTPKAVDSKKIPDWDSDEAVRILSEISAQIVQVDVDVTRLRDESPEDALRALISENAQLRHSEVLSQLLSDIEQFVEDAIWVERAAGPARRSLNTSTITRKEAELFRKVVAGGYRSRLSTECEKLNCMLPIEFKTEGQKGQTFRSISMRGGHSPNEILSEGEQRAIALADFLTEVGLNTANAGIILDDPVTSQDHFRKSHVARRLVEESQYRQVIIFTHDLVFLTMLAAEAAEQSAQMLSHWIERDSEGQPGQIALDDSPAVTPQYRDTKKSKVTLAEARAAVGSKRVKLVQRGMGELRRTLEEIVPHHLLKQVVNRWTDRVMVTALKKINLDHILVADIIFVYEDLSKFIEGHSHTEETTGAPPEPNDLEKRISEVDRLIKLSKPDK
ncbi:MAG: AAA family ATPase [Janthinobacterium lividum]